MRAHFLLLSVLIVLISCSGGNPVKGKFEIKLEGITATPYGGLVIYGNNGKDSFTRIISVGSGSVTEELSKNSTWQFGAVTWLGAEAFTGETRCAFQSVSIGAEDSVSVSLKLTNAGCVGANVAIPGTHTGVQPYLFNTITSSFCEGDVSTRTTSQCIYNSTIRPIEKGFAGSYQFVVKGTAGDILQSRCYRAGADDEPVAAPTYSTSSLNIPAFEPTLGFPLSVESFLSHDCSPGKGSLVQSLTNSSKAKIYSYTPGGNYLHLSTPSADLCAISDTKVTVTSPASGQGTMTSPFLICSEDQLWSIQSQFASSFGLTQVNAGVFVLGRDLNLLKFMGGLGGSPRNCFGFGDTFLPIGMDIDSSCNLISSLPTQGLFTFDGNGHTISHLRMKNYSFPGTALFTSFNGSLYDLNIDHADIEGGNNTAVLFGSRSMNGTFKMIRIKHSSVRGEDYVGSVFGFSNSMPTLFQNVFVSDTDVEGKDYTGGIGGSITTGTLTDLSFSGSVYSKGNTNVGGILGNSGATLRRISSSGILRAGATFMGGILGSGSLTYGRSDMAIIDYNGSTTGTRQIGGISGSGTIARSLFNGTITTACSGTCNVGGISGTTASTDSFSTFNPGLDGDSGSLTFDVDTVYTTPVQAGLCAADGSCPWVQLTGDIPRFNTFEVTGPEASICSSTVGRMTLAAQRTNDSSRGIASNPFIICRPSELLEMSSFSGAYFELAANLNLSLFAPGDLTIFDGNFNGRNYSLHSFNATSVTSSSSLFTSLDPGSTFRNTQLDGFIITSASCSGCDIAPLAATNNGSVSNVRIQDVRIQASGLNNFIGGLVKDNYGIIDSCSVNGNVASAKAVGGIVYRNYASITNSVSRTDIDGLNIASGGYLAGVAALNIGSIEKTRFKGKITGIDNARYVGGISSYAYPNSSFTNNEFGNSAVISVGLSTDSVGGILGFAVPTPTVTLDKNLSNGVITIASSSASTTIKALVGENTFVDNNNLTLTVPEKFVEIGTASPGVFNSGTNDCLTSITRTAGNGGLTVFGMIDLNSNYYFGNLIDNGTTYDFYTKTKDASECSSLGALVNIYSPVETRNTLNIASLKSAGWDIAALPAENIRALTAYSDILQGKTPSNPPVWIYEPGEEGLGLFHDD